MANHERTTGDEEQAVPEAERRLVLPSPEELLLSRWFSALHDAAGEFTVNTFGKESEARAGEEPKSPLKLVQDENTYRWQWREASPVEGGEYLRFMEMFFRPDVYEGKLTGDAQIFMFPETGVRFDGRAFETAELENRVHWKGQNVKLNAPRSTVERVAAEFGEALPEVWYAIGKHKQYVPRHIEFLRAEIEAAEAAARRG
ncbi:hypothetical protein M1615_01425 [Patescibacteria group bacterium]|nr:hypothetical protein [Patescibacteria group bacterium]MCL5010249.1 hypothetical protein [Patescibacteria group bacterium]